MPKSAGDSSEQREAEEWLVGALSRKLGVTLSKRGWLLDDGIIIELDGFCQSPMILCEAWAHIGTPKGAQPDKVMTDALKLLFVKNRAGADAELVLLFADEPAAKPFQGRGWMAQCLKEFSIKVEVCQLPQKLKCKVLEAQRRQVR